MEELSLHTIEMLKRKYFGDDKGFYANNLRISCFEQGQYQSLRKYKMDYFLFFCNDINIELSKESDKINMRVHNLHYNDQICNYHCVTTNYKEAEKCLDDILAQGKVVVFKTAMDYLQTYAWYHPHEPYTRTRHRSIIIGNNKNDYFYVDIPPTRNLQYFRSHPLNSEVGCINREELLASFEYACEIGYMEVMENNIGTIADIKKITQGIKQNYFCTTNKSNTDYLGKQALEELVLVLNSINECEKIDLDEFTIELVASRHMILRKNLCKYMYWVDEKNLKKYTSLLEELAEKWRIIRNIIIKNDIVPNRNIYKDIGNIVKSQIIPMTDKFFSHL